MLQFFFYIFVATGQVLIGHMRAATIKLVGQAYGLAVTTLYTGLPSYSLWLILGASSHWHLAAALAVTSQYHTKCRNVGTYQQM